MHGTRGYLRSRRSSRVTKLMLKQTLLFQDEKGPIAAKTYGGASWYSTQGKAEHSQKTKRIMNVFGAYDYTNDKTFTHCWKKKNSKQFLDLSKKYIHLMILPISK